ncbi:hypothetical protein [Pantoea stewartii]|uniref:hypothetical protein n=1 Tax=Pantoea stewartii TaxID=66269 RepID=UPI00249DB7B7|nr:hypothetical protein [Pantoea stewartii]
MRYCYLFAALAVATALSGCAKKQPAANPADAFAEGQTQIDVSHVITRADDGSHIYLTVDGKDAGELPNGESKVLHVPAGKHEVGGYVRTLFGLGRVTIDPLEVTTSPNDVKKVAYTVTRNKATFVEQPKSNDAAQEQG